MKQIALIALLLLSTSAYAGPKIIPNPNSAVKLQPPPPPVPSCAPGNYFTGHYNTGKPPYYTASAACAVCPKGQVSAGGTTPSCSACPSGQAANANNSACVVIPMCQKAVSGSTLKADAQSNTLPAYLSFAGAVYANGSNWWPPSGTTSLYILATQSTCSANWTWTTSNTTGSWVGGTGHAVACSYALTSAPKTNSCGDTYKGNFSIICQGSSCKF